jgi:hypothetical protein
MLRRDYFITSDDNPVIDVLGGNVLYSAIGQILWDPESSPGLIARVGEDYPQEWLDECAQRGIDVRGVRILPQAVDVRSFYVYTDRRTRITGDPVPHFAQRGLPFPKALLGYRDTSQNLDSRIQMTPISLRQGDIPEDYLDALAAHLCPLDYMTHSLLPALFRQAGFTTVTLDPSSGYMNPTYWNDVPSLVTGLTAFLPAEDDVRNLFQGRSEDLWEMAEALAAYGSEIVVIKCGESGQLLYEAPSRARWEVPAYPVKIVNPTGVGDAFCGGFLVSYRRHYDPLEAVLHGNISASIVAEGSGAFYALDVLSGLPEARLDALRQSVRKV